MEKDRMEADPVDRRQSCRQITAPKWSIGEKPCYFFYFAVYLIGWKLQSRYGIVGMKLVDVGRFDRRRAQDHRKAMTFWGAAATTMRQLS